MIVRIRTICNAVASELKGKRRTYSRFVPEEQSSRGLPGKRLVGVTETDPCNFVSALLVDGGDRPEGIENESEGRFVVDVETRLKTARDVGDVGEDSTWKGVFGEIFND